MRHPLSPPGSESRRQRAPRPGPLFGYTNTGCSDPDLLSLSSNEEQDFIRFKNISHRLIPSVYSLLYMYSLYFYLTIVTRFLFLIKCVSYRVLYSNINLICLTKCSSHMDDTTDGIYEPPPSYQDVVKHRKDTLITERKYIKPTAQSR